MIACNFSTQATEASLQRNNLGLPINNLPQPQLLVVNSISACLVRLTALWTEWRQSMAIALPKKMLWPWPLTSAPENLFSNAQSHVEYLYQVPFKSVHYVKRNRFTRNRFWRTTDGGTAYLKTYCLRRGFFDGGGKKNACLCHYTDWFYQYEQIVWCRNVRSFPHPFYLLQATHR